MYTIVHINLWSGYSITNSNSYTVTKPIDQWYVRSNYGEQHIHDLIVQIQIERTIRSP
jgi:hypothetical protein